MHRFTPRIQKRAAVVNLWLIQTKLNLKVQYTQLAISWGTKYIWVCTLYLNYTQATSIQCQQDL